MRSGGKKVAVRQYVRSTTPRMRWTAELHGSFLQAIELLGGLHNATPKLILQRMGTAEGLTIGHVKSHLQMHRGQGLDKWMKCDMWMNEIEPQLQRKHSCPADEQGPNSFMCPPLKRTKMETGATYKSMQQGSQQGINEMMRTCGTKQYSVDDHYMQGMSCLEQGSDTFEITKQLGAPQLGVAANAGDVCFLFSGEARRNRPEQCSLSLSLGPDPKGVRDVATTAAASSPSEGSCILSSSSSRRSSSDSSGHSGSFVTPDLNLELSMSIYGS